MSTNEYLIKLTTEAIEKLDLVMKELIKLPQSDRYEKYNVGAIGRSIWFIKEFQSPILDINPELNPSSPEDMEKDPPLDAEQVDIVNQLSAADIKKIDESLLSNVGQDWCKVARVVGMTMMKDEDRIPGIPDIYLAQRVRQLVKEGKLESQGNLAYMGYGEVRLHPKGSDR